MPDPFREKVAKAKKDSNAWKPEEGEILIGKVLAFRDIETRFGEGQVVDIEDEDARETVSVFMSTVLLEEFIRKKIVKGDRVGIKFLGKEKNYKNYLVEVDKPERETLLRSSPKPLKKKKKKEQEEEDYGD